MSGALGWLIVRFGYVVPVWISGIELEGCSFVWVDSHDLATNRDPFGTLFMRFLAQAPLRDHEIVRQEQLSCLG